MNYPTEVYIHVGIPKTGSTFLQRNVFPKMQGFLYYRKDEFLKTRINNLPNYSFSDDVEVLAKEINLYLREHRIEKLLISNESLFGHPLHNFLNHELLIRNLKLIFPQAKILIIIRNQVDFFESLYKYIVYLGYPVHKTDFFRNANDQFERWSYKHGVNISIYSLDYNRLIGVYEYYFGQVNLTILPYELLQDNALEFKFSLCNWLGSEIQHFPAQVKTNKGLSAFQINVLRILNRFFKSHISNGFGFINRNPYRRILLKKLGSSAFASLGLWLSNKIDPRWFIGIFENSPKSSKPMIFTEEQMKIIRDYYHDSNVLISRRYALPLEKYRYLKSDNV